MRLVNSLEEENSFDTCCYCSFQHCSVVRKAMGRKTSSTLDEVGSKTHGDLTAENKTADIYQRKRFQISLRQPGLQLR